MNLCATNIALFSCALLSASAPDNTSMSALPVHKNTKKLCSPQFPTSGPLKEHTPWFWWLLSSFRDPNNGSFMNPWMGRFHAPLLQKASAITEKLQLATRSIFFPRHDVGGNTRQPRHPKCC